MTRKDYVLLASAIKDVVIKDGEEHGDQLDGMRMIADSISNSLAQDNSRFDKARFMEACGFEYEV